MEEVKGADAALGAVKWLTDGSGDIWTTVAKVAILLVVGLGGLFLKNWMENAAAKKIDRQNKDGRVKDEADAVKENRETERDASAAEKAATGK